MFGVTVAAVAFAMPANADTINYPAPAGTDVLGTSASTNASTNVQAAGASANEELAFTGGTVLGIGALGGLLLVGGTTMVVASKRRKVNG
jgi:hypothetical protein